MKKKKADDRLALMIRYRVKEDNTVEFIDPCCDEIPMRLFGMVMQALSNVEKEWNEKYKKENQP